ncbi:hypothetical protein [Arthrobacter koreensis]|uniref:hypothetical protein n=1 Tax=Arthrobacter koreensis TaxID=199136 RepID=UPI00126559AB|nr:hypothetical protein [Arthrobacter koreensis]
MGIMERLEQQHREQSELLQTLELLSDLHGRLDGIEANQKEVVSTTNASTQSIIRIWTELELLRRQMQPQQRSDESAKASSLEMLTTLGNTQQEILELLSRTKTVTLPNGASVTAADLSGHALMQNVSAEIRGLTEANSRLADELHQKRGVSIDYEKLAAYMLPKLTDQLSAQTAAMQAAWAAAAKPVLSEMKTTQESLHEVGAEVSLQIRNARDQVRKLRGTVTWHTVGQIGAALLPFALVAFVSFGAAQTLWAAFGLQPILQTVWEGFSDSAEWQGKLAIVGGAFACLGVYGWVTWLLGGKLYRFYRGY